MDHMMTGVASRRFLQYCNHSNSPPVYLSVTSRKLCRNYVSPPNPKPNSSPVPRSRALKAQKLSTTQVLRPRKTLEFTSALDDILNPPRSTLPPSLSLPEQDPELPRYKYLFRLGKAYLAFYKTGFGAIISNLRLADKISKEVCAKHNLSNLGLAQRPHPFAPVSALHKSLRADQISRAEYLLFTRVKSDFKRIPLFGLLFAVCGEFTPLLVPFLSPIVPKTVWLPSQWEKSRKAAVARRQAVNESDEPRNDVLAQAQALDLYPALWDKLSFLPLATSNRLTQRLIARHQEISTDNYAIRRDGGLDKLNFEELQIACDLRGLDVLDKDERDMKANLQLFIDAPDSK